MALFLTRDQFEEVQSKIFEVMQDFVAVPLTPVNIAKLNLRLSAIKVPLEGYSVVAYQTGVGDLCIRIMPVVGLYTTKEKAEARLIQVMSEMHKQFEYTLTMDPNGEVKWKQEMPTAAKVILPTIP